MSARPSQPGSGGDQKRGGFSAGCSHTPSFVSVASPVATAYSNRPMYLALTISPSAWPACSLLRMRRWCTETRTSTSSPGP